MNTTEQLQQQQQKQHKKINSNNNHEYNSKNYWSNNNNSNNDINKINNNPLPDVLPEVAVPGQGVESGAGGGDADQSLRTQHTDTGPQTLIYG